MVHKLALILGGAGVAGVFALALVLGGSPFALPVAADSEVAALANGSAPTNSPEPTDAQGRKVQTVVDTVFVRPAPTDEATADPTAAPTADPTRQPGAEFNRGADTQFR